MTGIPEHVQPAMPDSGQAPNAEATGEAVQAGTSGHDFERRCEDVKRSLGVLGRTLLQAGDNGQADLVARLGLIVDAEVARVGVELSDVQAGDWASLAEPAAKAERLAAETLAFVGGLSARAKRLDRTSCSLADELLAWVAARMSMQYEPVTLPASSEYVNVLSEVIRVRFPGRGIWDLPLVLHEFGHFLVRRFRQTRDGDAPADIIRRESEKRRYLGAFAEELWADTFATYVGGPAYAFSLLSRFDPLRAHADSRPTHPAAIRRAAAIFATLASLERAWAGLGRGAGSLAPAISLVQARWTGLLRAAGVAVSSDAESQGQAVNLVGAFIEILDREHAAVRYENAQSAEDVRWYLLGQGPRPENHTPVSVLNGLWLARARVESRGGPDNLTDLAEVARDLLLRPSGDG